MNIHEAITRVITEGKAAITRTKWEGKRFVRVRRGILYAEQKGKLFSGLWHPTVIDLIAYDWEVIEDIK